MGPKPEFLSPLALLRLTHLKTAVHLSDSWQGGLGIPGFPSSIPSSKQVLRLDHDLGACVLLLKHYSSFNGLTYNKILQTEITRGLRPVGVPFSSQSD